MRFPGAHQPAESGGLKATDAPQDHPAPAATIGDSYLSQTVTEHYNSVTTNRQDLVARIQTIGSASRNRLESDEGSGAGGSDRRSLPRSQGAGDRAAH